MTHPSVYKPDETAASGAERRHCIVHAPAHCRGPEPRSRETHAFSRSSGSRRTKLLVCQPPLCSHLGAALLNVGPVGAGSRQTRSLPHLRWCAIPIPTVGDARPIKSGSPSSDNLGVGKVLEGALRRLVRHQQSETQILRFRTRGVHMGMVGCAFVSATSFSLLLSSAAQATDGAGSGATLLGASEAAIAHENSVHVVSVQSGTNVSANATVNATVTIATDAGSSEGIQRVSFEQRGTSGHETVEVTGGEAYFSGDSFTLENFNGFSAAAAARYAGTWLEVSPSEGAFDSLTSAVTMSTIPAQIVLPKPELLKGESTVSGTQVKGIRGVVATHSGNETGVLYVRSTGSPLPVKLTSSLVHGGHGSDVFSKWNETVTVTAPSSSIPFSSTGQ